MKIRAAIDLYSTDEGHMKILRRWLIYRRLVNELADVPDASLIELGTGRAAINEFAWRCAQVEAENSVSAGRDGREAEGASRGNQA